MVKGMRCTYCGKISYTSSPRFADSCPYCNQPFAEFRGKGAIRDERWDKKRKSREK